MDKKSLIIGLTCLGLAFFLLTRQGPPQPQTPPPSPPVEDREGAFVEETEELLEDGVAERHERAEPTPAAPRAPRPAPRVLLGEDGEALPVEIPREEPEGVALDPIGNDLIEVRFSAYGGSIREVMLKKYERTLGSKERYILNYRANTPMLAYMITQDQGASWIPYLAVFREVSRGEGPGGGMQVVLEGQLPDGLVLRRTFEIARTPEGGEPTWEPYLIRHRTEVVNTTDQPTFPGRFGLNLGTVDPVESDRRGEFLNFGYYSSGSATFLGMSRFDGGGFMSIFGQGRPARPFIQERTDVVWASVKNQFFTTVLTPSEPATGFFTRPIGLEPSEEWPVGTRAITGSVEFESVILQPGESLDVSASFYAGPKEYRRLVRMGERQDLIMQFGIFGSISKILLTFMNWLYWIIPNYGVAIILMTVVIKLLLWPLTAKAAKSAKKMSKIQAPLKELREKYKDNQQKLQQETLKLFKANRVNPLAGCLPILVQIPIFLALFWMLRSASELRFADFLWIRDLSQPDTIFSIAGFPINPLPLLMTVSMIYQMRMTTVSMDSTQAKIFKFMPFIFLIFCYGFSSGLVLYWTVQNLLTILQQYLTNRKDDPEGDQVVLPNAPKKKSRKKKN